MGKYIPGRPTLVPQNMAGAGSLLAANYVYKVAKPDGLTIGNNQGSFIKSGGTATTAFNNVATSVTVKTVVSQTTP